MQYSRDFLINLYRTMLRIRLCEESLVEPILSGEIRCPCHLYSGEEAIAAGVCACLNEKDHIFGNHRSHGHFLAKGGGVNELIAEVYCREGGCSRGRGGSMHLADPDVGMMGAAPIVAGTISLALGAALSFSIRKEKRVAVSFFGDGATGEGVLYECLNFAALKNLPIIFVCENNLYATHMPIRECRTDSNIFRIAEPFCIDARQADGNDVLLVYEEGKRAVEQCREGKGPVFLEFMTYRFRGHVGPDDNVQGSHTDIRPPEELTAWLEKDPILKFESYLRDNHLVAESELNAVREDVQREVKSAHLFAKNSPIPRDLEQYVFG